MGEIQSLWFWTSYAGKLEEAQHILGPLGYQVSQFKVEGFVPEVIEPQAEWIEDVAMEKLRQAKEILSDIGRADEAILIEDAGLFVDALNGFPGVYSSYVLKSIGNDGLLRLLDGIEDRTANFQSVALLWDGERTHSGVGKCPGRISKVASDGNGFGFDPIFIPDDLDSEGNSLPKGQRGVTSTDGIPFGGVDITVKEKFSHRKRALDALCESIAGPSS